MGRRGGEAIFLHLTRERRGESERGAFRSEEEGGKEEEEAPFPLAPFLPLRKRKRRDFIIAFSPFFALVLRSTVVAVLRGGN